MYHLLNAVLLACNAAAWSGWSTLRPIGTIRSVYDTKFGAPRQGAIVPDAIALLTIDSPGVDAHQALDGLDAYSHIWLLWAAHLNQHDAVQAKVRAPKLRGGKAGLFSTRSPFRPNPIGLSLVKLDVVDGKTLRLSGVDLVDGTPVIDVKPYLPQYDAPQPGAPVSTAEWVDPPPLEDVSFAPEAEAALHETSRLRAARATTAAASGRAATALMSDAAQLRRAIVQTLAADPRPMYRWKREQSGVSESADYDVSVDGVAWRCRFERCEGASEEEPTTERVTVLGLGSDES